MNNLLSDWKIVQLPGDTGEEGTRYFGRPDARWFRVDQVDLIPVRSMPVIDALDSAYWREIAREALRSITQREGGEVE